MRPPKLKSAIALPLPAILPDDAASRHAVQRDVLALHDECAARLLRYARTFGLEGEAAEDVVQDAFVALFRHLCLGRPRHSLNGWLFRVTRNLALKHRRSTNISPVEFASELLLERIVDPGATPEQRLSAGQRRRRLRAVMRALKTRDRQCLYLRAEGLAYRDIAKALGISLGSVSKSLTRAFARLAAADEG